MTQTDTDLPLPALTLRRRLARRLLDWYQRHRRDLPWRASSDPYYVWVSEVMLQQTQVATVQPYFARWVRRFPNLRALADADEADVLRLWQGLGYYSRARSLHRGARHVVEQLGGRLPENPIELRRLPGIGPYTAGAIASIAFGRDAAVVDGNVIRVLTRLFALGGSPQHQPLKNHLWELARCLIPAGQARDFNQALMELGSLICTPRSPSCPSCPLRASCRGLQSGQPETFPQLPKRPAVQHVQHAAALVQRGQRYLLMQMPEAAPRWASMWLFPTLEHEVNETAQQAALRALGYWCGYAATGGEVARELQHSVTRYRIQLRLVRCQQARATRSLANCQRMGWFTFGELSELALPSAHRKLANGLS